MVTKAEFREIVSAREQHKPLVFASVSPVASQVAPPSPGPGGAGPGHASDDRRRVVSVLLTDEELDSLHAARGEAMSGAFMG